MSEFSNNSRSFKAASNAYKTLEQRSKERSKGFKFVERSVPLVGADANNSNQYKAKNILIIKTPETNVLSAIKNNKNQMIQNRINLCNNKKTEKSNNESLKYKASIDKILDNSKQKFKINSKPQTEFKLSENTRNSTYIPKHSNFEQSRKSEFSEFKQFCSVKETYNRFCIKGFFNNEISGLRKCQLVKEKMERKLKELGLKSQKEDENKAKPKLEPEKEVKKTIERSESDAKKPSELRKQFYEKYIIKQDNSGCKEDNTTDDNDSKLHHCSDDIRVIKSIEVLDKLITDKNLQQLSSIKCNAVDSDYYEYKLAVQRLINQIQPDSFQQKITSSEIFNLFNINLRKVVAIPESFRDYASYLQHWLPLFEYECYSQLISLRNEGAKCKIANLGWNTKIQFSHNDNKFIYFKIEESLKESVQFECRNDFSYQIFNESDKKQHKDNSTKMNWIALLDCLRENDLILFSTQRIIGVYDLFDISSQEKAARFFKSVCPEEGKFLAVVDRKRKCNETYLTLKTDCSLKDALMKIIHPSRKIKPIFYCYYLTSLSTVLREYKALHAIEFSPYIKTILDPSRCIKEQITLKNPLSPDYTNWQEFLTTNCKLFNESQFQALKQVCELRRQEILLIQGPPGTGKTQTIHGMISMILSHQSNEDNKILICAPSNAAVDEIVCRLAKNGLLDVNGNKKKAELVRVGVLDYSPPEIVRVHSLDYLVDERMKKSTKKEDTRDVEEYQRRVKKIELIKEHIDNADKNGTTYDEFFSSHKRELEKLFKTMTSDMKKEFITAKKHQKRIDILKQLQTNN